MALEVSRCSYSDTSKERKIDALSVKLSVTTVWWVVCRELWIACQKTTFSGDPLVRLKQFVEAAEKDAKSTGKDKKSKRSNEKSESSSGGSGGSLGANAVGKTAAGKDEQDDWKPVGKARKSYADAFKKRQKNSSRSNLKDSTQAIGRVRLLI